MLHAIFVHRPDMIWIGAEVGVNEKLASEDAVDYYCLFFYWKVLLLLSWQSMSAGPASSQVEGGD